MLKLNGIFPPIPTSFRPDEDLALDKLQENLRRLGRFDLAGFLILGSNGEKVMLSDSEKRQVFDAARAAIPSDKLMLAGTGEQSTRATIAQTRSAAEAGADAALVLNPSYYRGLMTRPALVNHYHAVAEASSIPIIVYNMPACSGLDLTAEVVVELSSHPNIIGIKDSGGDITKMGEIVRGAEPDFQVLAGSAGFMLPALSVGAVGAIVALANIAPELCLALYRAFVDGDPDRAREIQFRIIPLNRAVTSGGGVPALKAAMDCLGLYGGPARLPIQPSGPSERALLAAMLEEHGIRI